MIVDISKVYLYVLVEEAAEVYVELPPERQQDGMRARLKCWLYGARGAAHGWECEYARTLVDIMMFRREQASACCFRNEERDINLAACGSDFIFEAFDEDLKWVAEELKTKYVVTVCAMLGPEVGDDKVATILNKVIVRGDGEITYEVGPRHVEKMQRNMRVGNCNLMKVSGSNAIDGDSDSDRGLEADEVKLYLSVVARANYLATDRPDVAFATKELCKSMAKPKLRDLKNLKTLCRYVQGHRRPAQCVRVDIEIGNVINVWDSDFACCRTSRKSTSGGCLTVGTLVLEDGLQRNP
jgi:hypothetical protein